MKSSSRDGAAATASSGAAAAASGAASGAASATTAAAASSSAKAGDARTTRGTIFAAWSKKFRRDDVEVDVDVDVEDAGVQADVATLREHSDVRKRPVFMFISILNGIVYCTVVVFYFIEVQLYFIG